MRGIVNDGSLSIFAGVVMAIVGVNQLATFLVFSWFSLLGSILFYRAFTITFPGDVPGHRRYAYLVFFLPSTIFWTADVSKEAIMTDLPRAGGLRVRQGAGARPGRVPHRDLRHAVGFLIRPNELLVVLAGFAVALMIRPAADRERSEGSNGSPDSCFMGVLLAVSVYMTLHYLKLGGSGGSGDVR